MTLPILHSWTANANDGVKYFSGTATYTKTIIAPQSWFQLSARMMLDLGKVSDMAEVSVNGTSFGLIWKPPYRVDVTSALRGGANRLEIKVTNEWNNRILGDQRAPAGQKILAAGRAIPNCRSPD